MQKIAAILQLEGPVFDAGTEARLEFAETVHRNAGLVVRETDQGRVILFMRAKSAAICAIELRRLDETSATDLNIAALLCGAISLGPVTIAQETVDGDAVEVAANLATILEPGDIFVSGTCRKALADKIPVDYTQLRENPSSGYRLVVDSNEVLSAIRHENPVPPAWSWKVTMPAFSMVFFVTLAWFWFNASD
jgi:class 3 adenylate cyclase